MPGFLTALIVLAAILPLPLWFLLILFPRSRFTQSVSESYLVFLLLGVMFIFVLVGTGVAGVGMLTQGGIVVTTPTPAVGTTPTVTAQATAAATSAATEVATQSATQSPVIVLPSGPAPIQTGDLLTNIFVASIVALTWIGFSSMNLLAGHWIYHEADRLKMPTIVSSVCVFFAFLSGPVGVFFFVLIRSLMVRRMLAIARANAQTNIIGGV
jgi:hypothetical protein